MPNVIKQKKSLKYVVPEIIDLAYGNKVWYAVVDFSNNHFWCGDYFYCQNWQKCWNLKFSHAKEEKGSIFIPDSQRGRGKKRLYLLTLKNLKDWQAERIYLVTRFTNGTYTLVWKEHTCTS